MREVTIEKDALREKVQGNRDKHRAIFEQAFAGFKEATRTRLEEHLAMLEKGKVPPLHLGIVVPEDHTDDYDRVLAMLDMSVDDEILLSQQEFSQYVLDQWGWQGSFTASTAHYTGENAAYRS